MWSMLSGARPRASAMADRVRPYQSSTNCWRCRLSASENPVRESDSTADLYSKNRNGCTPSPSLSSVPFRKVRLEA